VLKIFQTGESLFHTGWFIESLATQVLVIFIIRARRNPLKSRPNPWLTGCSLMVVALAIILPFTSLGSYLGLVPSPPLFFLALTGMVMLYLVIVKQVKKWFYRRFFSH
jgi:Mg2+-importing ATPase